METKLVPARLVHVGPLAANMRAIDRRECEAMGRSPKEALRGGLRCSLSAFTAMDGTKPVAMLGVVPLSLLNGNGVVWMLGTDTVFQCGRQLVRDGRLIVGEWLNTFSRLENLVASENAKALRLLKAWGFVIDDKPEVHGGVEFLPFHIGRAAIQGGQAVA